MNQLPVVLNTGHMHFLCHLISELSTKWLARANLCVLVSSQSPKCLGFLITVTRLIKHDTEACSACVVDQSHHDINEHRRALHMAKGVDINLGLGELEIEYNKSMLALSAH